MHIEKMTDAEILRRMAKHIRKYGFSPNLYEVAERECGCFLNAYGRVTGRARNFVNPRAVDAVLRIAGANVSSADLEDKGWTRGATEDAAAACEIAADLVSP